jgi:hypothetical protein
MEEKAMTVKQFLFICLLATSFSIASTSGWACSVAGPGKHIGQVTNVDDQAGTVTLLDAETNEPIVFIASSDILKEVHAASGQVMISYEERDGKLIAKNVSY